MTFVSVPQSFHYYHSKALWLWFLNLQLIISLANHSGKTFEQIEKDSDRDNWMKAKDAKKYGLIDEVLERHSGKDDA